MGHTHIHLTLRRLSVLVHETRVGEFLNHITNQKVPGRRVTLCVCLHNLIWKQYKGPLSKDRDLGLQS